MSFQTSPFSKVDSKSSLLASRVEAIAGDRFSIRKFVENFDVLVNVAGSTKRLKEMVLQLAVRGSLSVRTDETADALVAQLHGARSKLAKTGVRVVQASPPIEVDEVPHPIPPGWRWVRLHDLGGFLGGGTPAKSNAAYWKGPLPWVSPKDMKRLYIDDAEDHISIAAVEGSAVKLIPSRSILYVVRGMILAHSFPVAINTQDVTINQDMKALVLALPALSEFILRACQAARERVLAKVERSSHGTCRLDSEAVEMLPIALPPLIEQKRIVAKVNSLMALCDDLEIRQTEKRKVGTRLTRSTLEALTTAESSEGFETAWTRAVENFDTIVDRAEMSDELRRAIRDLAVSGRLLPFSDDRKGRRRDDGPFVIPAHWAWSALGELAEGTSYGTSQKAHEAPKGVAVLRMNNIQDGRLDLSSLKFVPSATEKIEELMLHPGDLLFNRTNSYELVGKMAVFRETTPYTFASYLIRVRLDPSMAVPEYVNLYFGSSVCRRMQIEPHITRQTNQANFNGSKLKEILVPTPSVDEQRRIVAKAEQLMKVCDDLESKLRHAEDRASKLVGAAVQELVTQGVA